MAAWKSVPIPEIFVLWHPQCPIGEKLAQRILQWLRPGNGLGPEVFYRSLPAPAAPSNARPLPLPKETTRAAGSLAGEASSNPDEYMRPRQKITNLQVVLPLIDENMVADRTWRRWLEDLTKSPLVPGERVVMPVALDATAYNMPDALRKLNYLRPNGLPWAAGEAPDGAAFEIVVRSLLKQLTETLCRLMLPRPEEAPGRDKHADPLPKVNVFLSHSKQDGTGPARRLRNYIYSQTQLTAFFDENDIAFGSAFSAAIENGLGSSPTAALIAVRSASYASRPWCRREFSLFRQPQCDAPSESGAERWFSYPSLVVEAMEAGKSSAGIAEFGNSTLIRWDEDVPDMEELIITTVIRDAMLASFHSALAVRLPSEKNQIVINTLPDPTTLLHIPRIRAAEKLEVLYPGRGLSSMELATLDDFFPTLVFRSFEEVLS